MSPIVDPRIATSPLNGLKCEDRPYFHPMSKRGWASDPSGPLHYKGRYHMFFQHNPESCQWHWGLGWDHVVSDDLVNWKKLPPAIMPTPGWFDADGCFTGAVEVDPETGLPVIIYTGVYLKSNEEAVSKLGLPAPEYDLQLRFVETQLAAVPEDPDDPDLTVWCKLPDPVIRYPPASVPLSCWRDPCFLQKGDPQTGKEWVLLMCSGVRNVGGAVIAFKSKRLLSGWEYVGMITKSEDKTLGIDWECPILTELYEEGQLHAPSEGAGAVSNDKRSRWFFGMSPDACNNPVYYWLGDFDGKFFDVSAAKGPYKADLGKTLYAATNWTDPKGRQMLIGWIQEHKRVATPPAICKDFAYAGCLSVPRILTLKDGRLFQSPLPEIDALRSSSACWEAANLLLTPAARPYPLPVVSGNHLDIVVVLEPPKECQSLSSSTFTSGHGTQRFSLPGLPDSLVQKVFGSPDSDSFVAKPAVAGEGETAGKVGLILTSWRPDGEGAAIISFDWATHMLLVDFNEPVPHAYDPFPDPTKAGAKQVGGQLSFLEPGVPLELRILMDGSAVEIFTSTGEVLTTRMYRKTSDKPTSHEDQQQAPHSVQNAVTPELILAEDVSSDVGKVEENERLSLTEKLLEAEVSMDRLAGSEMIKAHLGTGEVEVGSTSDDDSLLMRPFTHGSRSSSSASFGRADSLMVEVPSEALSVVSLDTDFVAEVKELTVDDVSAGALIGKDGMGVPAGDKGLVEGDMSADVVISRDTITTYNSGCGDQGIGVPVGGKGLTECVASVGEGVGEVLGCDVSAAGVYLFAEGVEVLVKSAQAWEMKSCWVGVQIDE